jgi:Reverse transcriptase (RNA-dependent DNA polymerase)
MFIGYSNNHAANVFHFYNLQINSSFFSRNITWLCKSYGEYQSDKNSAPPPPQPSIVEIELSDDISDAVPIVDPVILVVDNVVPIDLQVPPRTRLDRERCKITTYFNPNPGEHMDFAMVGAVDGLVPTFTFVMASTDLNLYPKTIRDALTRNDHDLWWQAACTEFKNCESKKAWVIIKKCNVPKGRKIIGNCWVLALKDDGRYRSRTVAKGFSQIPGQDFQENHVPVVHDTTFHLILVFKIINGLRSRQFDVETAFLYGTLDEEIYMELPEGYKKYLQELLGKIYSSQEHCVMLLCALYGLVQAAPQWYKKIQL